MTKYIYFLLILFFSSTVIRSQTAVNSGNWTACNTLGFPNYITNTVSAGKAIGNNVNVTANATWSMSNLDLAGNGIVNVSNGVVLDFVADTGPLKSCASFNLSWDVPPNTAVGAPSTINTPFSIVVNANSANIPVSSFLVGGNTVIVFPFTGNYDITFNDDFTQAGATGNVNQQIQIYDANNNLKVVMVEQNYSGTTWGPIYTYYTNVNLVAGDYMVRRMITSAGYFNYNPRSRPGMIRFNPS